MSVFIRCIGNKHARMCDMQCTAGIGITVGLVGIMMTIICCKSLCEFMIELSKPDVPQTPARTGSPTVIEMPIVIRIHFPQLESQRKNEFEPLPV